MPKRIEDQLKNAPTDLPNIDEGDLNTLLSVDDLVDIDPEADFRPRQRFNTANIVMDDFTAGGSISGGFSMTKLLSGDTFTATTAVVTSLTASTQLSLDISDVRNLAYFGSVFTRVAIAIDKVKDQYPNGVIISTVTTASTSVTLLHSNIEDRTHLDMLDTENLKNFNLAAFDENGNELQNVGVVSALTNTLSPAITSIELGANFTGGAPWYALTPNESVKAIYFASVPQYEDELVSPPTTRSNSWPKHSAATDVLLFQGDDYDSFVSTELALGLSGDTVQFPSPSNVLWNRMFPDGVKTLDNDDEILQKFVLTLGLTFDKIKQYQDQMTYAHTLGLDDFNHIPRSLVTHLASLWGWKLGHDTDNNDLTLYRLKTYTHYITGITRNMSSEDINFERWRRILSSLVKLYKTKGTRKAIEFIMDIYGIPDNLLKVREYITTIDIDYDLTSLRSQQVPDGQGVFLISGNSATSIDETYYVEKATGDLKRFGYKYNNEKFLDVAISETAAIEFDLWDWGVDNFPSTLSGADGNVVVLSGTGLNESDFEAEVLSQFIPSDGSYRIATSAPLLANVYETYLTNSVNAFTRGDLDPYIAFIEENYPEIVAQFVPASSRLLGQGTLHRNPYFQREKFPWKPFRRISYPFNEEVVLPPVVLVAEKKVQPTGIVTTVETSGSKQVAESASIQTIVESGTKFAQPTDSIIISTLSSNKQVAPAGATSTITGVTINNEDVFADSDSIIFEGAPDSAITDEPRGYVAQAGTPPTLLVNATSSLVGFSASSHLEFTAFTVHAVILTNSKILDAQYAATNVSSGITRVLGKLYRINTAEDIEKIESKEYSIMKTIYEGDDTSYPTGSYVCSSVSGMVVGDTLMVKSNIQNRLQSEVTVEFINYSNNRIVVSPRVGITNLPIGRHNQIVTLKRFILSEKSGELSKLLNIDNVTVSVAIELFNELSSYPDIDNRDLPDFARYGLFISSLGKDNNINQHELGALAVTFYLYGPAELAASLILIPFLKEYSENFYLNNNIEKIADDITNRVANVRFIKKGTNFDFSKPVQIIDINNDNLEGWDIPDPPLEEPGNRDQLVQGALNLGGKDPDTNEDILIDKSEYFLEASITTEVSTAQTGVTLLEQYSGKTVESSPIPINYYGSERLSGSYFVYMNPAKEANPKEFPVESSMTESSSILLTFNGVGDANELEVQFYNDGTAAGAASQNNIEYSTITESDWSTAATVNVPIKDFADDGSLYTLRHLLDTERWYWWRIKSTKIYTTMFEYDVKSLSTSIPKLFATAEVFGGGAEEGTKDGGDLPPKVPPGITPGLGPG